MSRKFKIGGSSKSLKDFWKEKVAAAASLKTNDGKWNDVTDLSTASDDDYKNFKFKVNTKGEMEPILSDADIGPSDIVFGASKSNLRRMADLERNVSILANQLSTLDGDEDIDDDSSELFDNWITKDTAFTKDVTLGRSGSTSWWSGSSTSRVDIDGHLYLNNGLTLGSTAREVFQDLIGGMVTGNTESGISVTYDDSSNEFDFDISSAPKWETARTITLSGDATGSVQFDGSANKTLSIAVKDDSHNHVMSNIDGLAAEFATKADVSYVNTEISNLVNGANSSFDTLKEIQDAMATDVELSNAISGLTIGNGSFSVGTGTGLSGSASMTANQTGNTSGSISLDLSYTDGRYDNYNGWDLYTDGTSRGRITTGENVNFIGGSNVSLSYSSSNNAITINSTDTNTNTNNYLSSATFSTSNGVLTLNRSGLSAVTVDLDGRFTDNGYADTMNQHVRTTDSPTFANVTATAFNGTATYAKYADLAERYAADAEYAEGTVMAFGGDAEVTAAAGYGSGKLAGVVSHKPAVAMNAEAGNDQTHPYIALQGRVPVRVEGDVKKGDILVASDIAGLAAVWMNADADPRMTAYVGIAISDSADGMVEVKVGK